MQWKLPLDVDNLWAEMPDQVSFADVVNQLCLLRRGSSNSQAWGDKTPQYIRHLDIIDELFPEAKFIYIVRDGRDVALSLLKKSWGPHNVYACALDWVASNQPSPTLDELERRGQLMYVKYEELLSDPETNVNAIYQFLGENISDQRAKELCTRTRGDNMLKWKTEMSSHQLGIFEAVAGSTLLRLGYETYGEEHPISALERFLMRFHDNALRAKHLFVVNVVDGFRIRFLGAEPFDK